MANQKILDNATMANISPSTKYMRHSTKEEQETYNDMLSSKSTELTEKYQGHLAANQIYLLLDLLEVLNASSEGYSYDKSNWLESAFGLISDEVDGWYEEYDQAVKDLKDFADWLGERHE